MAIETDADRAIFVSADDFGVKAVWTSAGGASAPFDCIFDSTFMAMTAGELEFTQEGAHVRIEMRSTDVPDDSDNDDTVQTGSVVADVFVASASYKVVEFKPDGTGMTVVRLMEA